MGSFPSHEPTRRDKAMIVRVKLAFRPLLPSSTHLEHTATEHPLPWHWNEHQAEHRSSKAFARLKTDCKQEFESSVAT